MLVAALRRITAFAALPAGYLTEPGARGTCYTRGSGLDREAFQHTWANTTLVRGAAVTQARSSGLITPSPPRLSTWV